jgi:predicted MFS family arabinose efflux permease
VQQLPGILSGLLLIEIAETFNTSIGVMGQMRTISALFGLLAALLMGFLSVKYSYGSLLLAGLTLLVFSSLGCSLSSDYLMMLVFYALLGISTSISGPMVNSLIGQHIPQAKRAAAIGLIMSSAAFAYLVGSPSIAYLSIQFNWRVTFQIFIVPLITLCLIISILKIPRSKNTDLNTGFKSILDGYNAILRNRSAAACLLGGLFSSGIWSSYLTFSASFIRQTFLLSSFFTSISTIIGASFFILGSLSSGRLVAKIGIKKLAVYSSIPSGLLILLYLNTPNFWLTLVIGYIAAYSNGVLLSATGILNLEQMPLYRGTMMSLSAAIGSLGAALGTGVVGWLIVWGGYGVSGLYMLAAGIIASLIYHKLVEV